MKSFSGLCTMKADFMQTASKNLSVLAVVTGCSEHSWESPPFQAARRCCQSWRSCEHRVPLSETQGRLGWLESPPHKGKVRPRVQGRMLSDVCSTASLLT